jgi:hypothetical protein
MNLPELQNQITQTAEATSTLFVLIPILVMMIPLLVVVFPLLALKPPFCWFVSLYRRLMKQ